MSSIRISTLVLLLTGALAAAGKEEIPPFSGNAQDYYTTACASCHGVTGNGRDNSGRALPKTGFEPAGRDSYFVGPSASARGS